MKVAIIHEWFDTYAGSERVVEQFLQIWPEADLFALVDFLPPGERGFLGGRPVKTSFLQRMPFARKHFRNYLQLMPLAIEQFDMTGYDLVVSSNHAVAKGVVTGPGQLHVSYVHSPMRYAWDLQHQYLRESGLERGLRGIYVRWLLHNMRLWDRNSARGVDSVLANSRYIAERIRKAWRVDSTVIHPPVDVDRFTPGGAREEFYLIAARTVPYKRVELVAEAFRAMPDRRLVICGEGPNDGAVRAAAGGAPNIELRGRVEQAELLRLIRAARAFVYPAEEDFGIGMVEAQACGTPVIAYARGGACDIVQPDTGILFPEQTAAAIRAAVEQFEARPMPTAEACRANAMRFSAEAFRTRIAAHVAALQDAAA